MNRIYLLLLSLAFISCQEDKPSIKSNLNFYLKGKIFENTLDINDRNSAIIADEINNCWVLGKHVYLSGFRKDNFIYYLSNYIPCDTLENNDLYSLFTTGKYNFEKPASDNSDLAFRLDIVEETPKGYILYSTYDKEGKGELEIQDIIMESDTTLIIQAKFNCSIYLLDRELVSEAENIEFRNRFILK